jgi:Uma2 family endonuclease
MHMASRQQGAWTLEQMHRLPEDGNTYEVIHGELFVSPGPRVQHQNMVNVLADILRPFVQRWDLGRVVHPRCVIRFSDSEVEPDLMVRPLADPAEDDWARLPLPELVVEVVSGTSRIRDYNQKRSFYLELGIPEYWIVDGQRREITIVRHGMADAKTADLLTWHPHGAGEALQIDVRSMFQQALGAA